MYAFFSSSSKSSLRINIVGFARYVCMCLYRNIDKIKNELNNTFLT